jgi:hypothetical protein
MTTMPAEFEAANTPAGVLRDSFAREVFGEVYRNRSIRLDQLGTRFPSRPETKIALQHLLGAQLVSVRPSLVDDFSTYFVTADGLKAGREWQL